MSSPLVCRTGTKITGQRSFGETAKSQPQYAEDVKAGFGLSTSLAGIVRLLIMRWHGVAKGTLCGWWEVWLPVIINYADVFFC